MRFGVVWLGLVLVYYVKMLCTCSLLYFYSLHPVRSMSVNQNSSGDEGALCIDTERKSGAEKSKGKSGKKKGHGKGKGAAKGKGKGANKNGVQESKDLKAGDVVWAKVPGFNHWPAKVCIYASFSPSAWPYWSHIGA